MKLLEKLNTLEIQSGDNTKSMFLFYSIALKFRNNKRMRQKSLSTEDPTRDKFCTYKEKIWKRFPNRPTNKYCCAKK